ncbi:MAG: hypothetical protein BGO29_07335 [Bacteroidales bacterium 36-12]|jgi:hypothetical protein|nr:MAG: hypothetical protein BGO29_07335 [Bacteroidales bacterium 36-12]
MIYKFTLLSDEADNFLRIINIDSEAFFLDLHNIILDSVNFEKNLLTTFFICSDDWEKGQEITLIEMDSGYEFDNLVMEDTKLEDLISDEKQKLMFIFDMMDERAFFMELSEIIPGKRLSQPECVVSKGDPPSQSITEEEILAGTRLNLDETFYGDEDFDIDELDEEGYGDMSFDDGNLFNDDNY